MSRRTVCLLAAPVLALGSTAGAALVGNDLVSRAAATDGATDVFQIYRTDPVPGPGVIKSFATYNQGGGGNFNAYVLRPTGAPNEYTVLFDSGVRNVAAAQSGVVNNFQHAPVAVQAGDLIAHYRNGIPYVDGGEDPAPIYSPSPTPPTQGSTITVGGPGGSPFPDSTFVRT